MAWCRVTAEAMSSSRLNICGENLHNMIWSKETKEKLLRLFAVVGRTDLNSSTRTNFRSGFQPRRSFCWWGGRRAATGRAASAVCSPITTLSFLGPRHFNSCRHFLSLIFNTLTPNVHNHMLVAMAGAWCPLLVSRGAAAESRPHVEQEPPRSVYKETFQA